VIFSGTGDNEKGRRKENGGRKDVNKTGRETVREKTRERERERERGGGLALSSRGEGKKSHRAHVMPALPFLLLAPGARARYPD
jgi:hypothetical protein